MKRFFIMLAVMLAAFLVLGDAPLGATTWEGEFNPLKFPTWGAPMKKASSPEGNLWYFMKNPDITSSVKIVVLEMTPDGTGLISYRYFKSGEPFEFKYMLGRDHFQRTRFTPTQRAKCLSCHQGKN